MRKQLIATVYLIDSSGVRFKRTLRCGMFDDSKGNAEDFRDNASKAVLAKLKFEGIKATASHVILHVIEEIL